MPWQCRRNALLSETRAERDIRMSLDDRGETNRQLNGTATIVAIEEDNDVGRVCRGQPRKARPPVSAAWFPNDASSHPCGNFGCSVIRVAVNNDHLRDEIRRRSARTRPIACAS